MPLKHAEDAKTSMVQCFEINIYCKLISCIFWFDQSMIMEKSPNSPVSQFSHVKYSFLIHCYEVFSSNFDTVSNDSVQIRIAKIYFLHMCNRSSLG